MGKHHVHLDFWEKVFFDSPYPTAKNKMKEGAHLMTKELLQREAWRAILLNSQRHYPFKILAKYNIIKIQGVLCKLTINDPLAISLLGTDVTP